MHDGVHQKLSPVRRKNGIETGTPILNKEEPRPSNKELWIMDGRTWSITKSTFVNINSNYHKKVSNANAPSPTNRPIFACVLTTYQKKNQYL